MFYKSFIWKVDSGTPYKLQKRCITYAYYELYKIFYFVPEVYHCFCMFFVKISRQKYYQKVFAS